MDRLILSLNPENTKVKYNSFIEFNMDIQEMVDKRFGEIFELEFLSKKVEQNFHKKTITYFFNVTKEKEEIVLELIQQIIISFGASSMNSISLN